MVLFRGAAWQRPVSSFAFAFEDSLYKITKCVIFVKHFFWKFSRSWPAVILSLISARQPHGRFWTSLAATSGILTLSGKECKTKFAFSMSAIFLKNQIFIYNSKVLYKLRLYAKLCKWVSLLIYISSLYSKRASRHFTVNFPGTISAITWNMLLHFFWWSLPRTDSNVQWPEFKMKMEAEHCRPPVLRPWHAESRIISWLQFRR